MSKRFRLYNENNLDALKKLPDNSIDSIVSDPPYGLSFMNKKWDYDVPSVEFWREVYRVLKPGGHILSFGGTRTYHRMVVNIEDAGFEIRDTISWLYSTGFPKSLNVEKQIEKNNYEVCRCKSKLVRSETQSEHNLRSMSETYIQKKVTTTETDGKVLFSKLPQQNIQTSKHTTCDVWSEQPSLERRSDSIQEEGQLQRHNLYESTGLGEANGEKGRLYNATQVDNGSNDHSIINENRSGSSHRSQSEQQSTIESGTLADQQQPQKSRMGHLCRECGKPIIESGIGTALKPAQELICLARKPLSEKSVAENVLKWRTGGINVDGCRVATGDKLQKLVHQEGCNRVLYDSELRENGKKIEFVDSGEGRFPANIIFDEDAAELLDEQCGIVNQGHWPKGSTKGYGDFGGGENNYQGVVPKDKTKSGASRFFYVAKVSKKERNLGLDRFEYKKGKSNISGLDDKPRLDGTIRETPIHKNNHPTVKPINLLTYLCRLITPPNGIILDPFMGSGSTGIAAQLEGFRFVGMELDEDYFKIAEARITNWEQYKSIIK